MSDRLPRSNSQTHLPNYGQGQPNENNKEVDKKKDGAPARSDKNTGRGDSDKNKAVPQMKSKEEKKVKAPSESDSDDGAKVPDTFGRLFLGKDASALARKYEDSDESSFEEGAPKSEGKTLKSPRQQQSDNKEKTASNKVPKLSLKNLGNVLGSLVSDRREMAISPRKTNRETHRNTQDSISSSTNAAANERTTTTTTTTASATTANTALGNAAIPRPTMVGTVPLSQPVSPRSHWYPTSPSNPPASTKPA